MIIQPVTLEGRRVRLVPLSLSHYEGLCEVGLDPQLWELTTTQIRTRGEMLEYIQTALRWQEERTALPFVILERSSGRIVGSTRYGKIDCGNRRGEIGWTWISPRWQRTFVNTETKYLLLKHAFEVLRCMRVEFKTDSLNHRSRAALLRIGATQEGIFRNHMITSSGRIRHSVYFSIIDSEWEHVKRALEGKLESSTI